MDDVAISDSEDEDWRSPIHVDASINGDKVQHVVASRSPFRSVSPDELALTLYQDDGLQKNRVLPRALSIPPQSSQAEENVAQEDMVYSSSQSPIETDPREDIVAEVADPQVATPEDLDNNQTTNTSSRRVLRPRTYQQLHTYEYEHAKYVLECRAAGIKPVIFDGTKYREMDLNDEDYIPKRVSSLLPKHDIGPASDGSTDDILPMDEPHFETQSQKKRRVKWAYKDPRNYVFSDSDGSAGVHTLNASLGVFDFPDEHWQDTRLSHGPISVSSETSDSASDSNSQSSQSSGLVSLQDSLLKYSQDDDTLLKARYAKQLRGVLPPSFLLRRDIEDNSRERSSAIRKHKSLNFTEHAAQHSGKGYARKKFRDSPSNLISSNATKNTLSISLHSDEMTPTRDHGARQEMNISHTHLPDMNSKDEDRDDHDEMSVGSEEFDRMLPREHSRSRSKEDSLFHIVGSKRAARVKKQQIVSLQHAAAIQPIDHMTRNLRLALRAGKGRKRKPTQLSRKYFNFHDEEEIPYLSNAIIRTDRNQPRKNNDVRTEHNHARSIARLWALEGPISTRDRAGKILNPSTVSYRSGLDKEQRKKRNFQGKRRAVNSIDGLRLPVSPPDSNASRYHRFNQSSASNPWKQQKPMIEGDAASLSSHGSDVLLDDDVSSSRMDRSRYDSANKPVGEHSELTGELRDLSKYRARTFSANLEHVTDVGQNRRRTKTAQQKRVTYVQMFDQIVNIFGHEESHYAKVSNWQRKQVHASQKPLLGRVPIQKQQTIIQRGKGARFRGSEPAARHLPRQILLPVRMSNPSRMPDVHSAYLDNFSQYLDSSFHKDTFLGSGAFARLLKNTQQSTQRKLEFITSQSNMGWIEIGNSITLLTEGISECKSPSGLSSLRRRDLYARLCALSQVRDRNHLQHILETLRGLLQSCDTLVDLPVNLQQIQLWMIMLLLTIAARLDEDCLDGATDLRSLELERCASMFGRFPIDTLCDLFTYANSGHDKRQIGYVCTFADSLLELWIVFFHVSQTTAKNFWARTDDLLGILDCRSWVELDISWHKLLHISMICCFDDCGAFTSSHSTHWPAVEMMLRKEFQIYTESSGNDELQCVSAVRVHKVLKRIILLIQICQWSGCNVLLGLRRNDGVLYQFFIQAMQLADLAGENPAATVFLRDLHNLDIAECVKIETGNAFGAFLKLVCLGILEHLKFLDMTEQDLQRIKKRGIGLIDKFATHGKLNYPATESIDKHTVSEIQNRWSLEIAVYWCAGTWKDRGLNKMIDASRAAMLGSHLALRDINLWAWQVVVRMQLKRSEDHALEDSISWFQSIVGAGVSDVLRFRHEQRINPGNRTARSQLKTNLKKCHTSLLQCFAAYSKILREPLSSTTPKRLVHIWSNKSVRAILLVHDTFIDSDRTFKVIDQCFEVATMLIDLTEKFISEEDSQIYSDFPYSQTSVDLIDYEALLTSQLNELTSHVFQYLTNISSHEIITTSLKVLAKLGLKTFAKAIGALHRRTRHSWQDYFSDRGTYSWTRLLDHKIKSVMLPYLLAILITEERTFATDMSEFIISSWFTAVADLEIRDSLATLTNTLLRCPQSFLRNEDDEQNIFPQIDAGVLNHYRLPLLGQAFHWLETVVSNSDQERFAIQCLQNLAMALKHNCESATDDQSHPERLYSQYIPEVLATMHQYCPKLTQRAQIQSFPAFIWLYKVKSFTGTEIDFAAFSFRAYAEEERNTKAVEIALVLIARCEASLFEESINFPSFLIISLGNNPSNSEIGQSWGMNCAKLRGFIVLDLLASLAHIARSGDITEIYLHLFIDAIIGVYRALLDQAWRWENLYLTSLVAECVKVQNMAQRYEELTLLAKVTHGIIVKVCGTDCSKYNCDSNSPEPESAWQESRSSLSLTLAKSFESAWSTSETSYFHTRRNRQLEKAWLSARFMHDSDSQLISAPEGRGNSELTELAELCL